MHWNCFDDVAIAENDDDNENKKTSSWAEGQRAVSRLPNISGNKICPRPEQSEMNEVLRWMMEEWSVVQTVSGVSVCVFSVHTNRKPTERNKLMKRAFTFCRVHQSIYVDIIDQSIDRSIE